MSAKLTTLTKEFDNLRAKVTELPFWNELLSIDETITVRDWILLDALYRSRSLGLPKSGESMVPCLDLVNHSIQATAYFEENYKGEVLLNLRKGNTVARGGEITIDYGHDKSPAEMLFSYGFIDPDSTTRSLVLPLESLDDDPLAAAKLHAFGTSPKLRLEEDERGIPHWTAPFVYLMCLNEEGEGALPPTFCGLVPSDEPVQVQETYFNEQVLTSRLVDGLKLRVLQETDGSRHLKMFWQDVDITDEPSTIRDVIQSHELHQVFELRVTTVVLNIIQQKLDELTDAKEHRQGLVRAETRQAVSYLRSLETGLLEKSLQVLEEQVRPNPSFLSAQHGANDCLRRVGCDMLLTLAFTDEPAAPRRDRDRIPASNGT